MHHLNWPQVGIVYLFLTVWLLCTGFIKNIVACYNINDLCVYGCFVDASKAFDRVNHSIPFDRLLKRDLSPVIRYSDQNVCVSWIVRFLTNEVSNGLHQGGLLWIQMPVTLEFELCCRRCRLGRYACMHAWHTTYNTSIHLLTGFMIFGREVKTWWNGRQQRYDDHTIH